MKGPFLRALLEKLAHYRRRHCTLLRVGRLIRVNDAQNHSKWVQLETLIREVIDHQCLAFKIIGLTSGRFRGLKASARAIRWQNQLVTSCTQDGMTTDSST